MLGFGPISDDPLSSLPLLGSGGPTEKTGDLNLFLQVSNNPSVSGEITLYITTATQLFVGMNLFVNCDDAVAMNAAMNLQVTGGYAASSGALPLIINPQQGSGTALSGGMILWVSGTGLISGAVPLAGELNLIINRHPSAAMNLFIAANSPLAGGVDLYTSGLTSVVGSTTLAMPATVGKPTGNLTLFTRGF